jgi:hypothetical protein
MKTKLVTVSLTPNQYKDRNDQQKYTISDQLVFEVVKMKRVKKFLDSLISETQKGFIKGRYIGECTRLVSDIIYHLKKNNQSGILFYYLSILLRLLIPFNGTSLTRRLNILTLGKN